MEELYELISHHSVIFLDLETNGLAVNTDILEIGALKFGPDGEKILRSKPKEN